MRASQACPVIRVAGRRRMRLRPSGRIVFLDRGEGPRFVAEHSEVVSERRFRRHDISRADISLLSTAPIPQEVADEA